MDIASVVAGLNKAAESVEGLSGLVMHVADKATEVLDGLAEALENAAAEVNERSENAQQDETGGREKPSQEYMYQYLKEHNPTIYGSARVETFLKEQPELLERNYQEVLLLQKVQADVRANGRFGSNL